MGRRNRGRDGGEAGRKRVVIIVQNLPVPFDRRVWLEALSLTKEGYAVTCICPKAKGFNKSFEEIDGIRIHRYHLPVLGEGAAGFFFEFAWCFVRTALIFGRELRTRGVDVLHVCNPPETYFPLAWLAKRRGTRFLFDHHDLSPEMYDAKYPDGGSRLLRWGLVRLERRTFRAADLVITTNESHKEVAIRRGSVNADEVIIVRSGPDLDRLQAVPPVASWRDGKKHLVVYLGEMCVQDGVDHLIRAMVEIRDRYQRDDVHCVLVGGGPHQQAIRDYASSIGAADLFHFTGRVSDESLCEILSSADIGVAPDPITDWSDRSTMNKIMEYMCFGLPIVSYDLKESRISAGDAARFATEHNEQSLADSIVALLDDPLERARMSKIGRDRVETQLSWKQSEPNLLKAYERLVGTRS